MPHRSATTSPSRVYLVDTNVLSANAPTKAQPNPDLAAWMDRNSDRLFLSVITIAEVEDGIAKARREGAVRKADRLAAWSETVMHLYGDRILPVDLAVARVLGVLSDQARAAGLAPGFADLAIAATARCRNCTVLTRNVRHFISAGVQVHDPFDTLPA